MVEAIQMRSIYSAAAGATKFAAAIPPENGACSRIHNKIKHNIFRVNLARQMSGRGRKHAGVAPRTIRVLVIKMLLCGEGSVWKLIEPAS